MDYKNTNLNMGATKIEYGIADARVFFGVPD
jgi:hypothetical protein